jgi:hypothetical protein
MAFIRIILVFLLSSSIFAQTNKIYFYTTENNIKDFKQLKINFDQYLKEFGEYTFQPFTNKEMFEGYIKDSNSIIMLSSWHYKQIAKKYNFQAKLVALKKQSITDTKVIVGKKGLSYDGTITTAYSKEYAKELINKITTSNNLNVLNVPKDIDALMSVGFGMSKFALISKESFDLIKNTNSYLANELEIYSESTPVYRMIVATSLKHKHDKKALEPFNKICSKEKGKQVLEILGIDDIVLLSQNDLKHLGENK